MFGLFKKKSGNNNLVNRVWVTTDCKWAGCLSILEKNPDTVFVVWFDETFDAINSFLESKGQQGKVIFYREAHAADAGKYIFAEHYPLASKEHDLFEKLGLEKTIILSALDEPLFRHFGSDKIVDMIKMLGMKQDDMIEHQLITGAITKAQEKLDAQIQVEQSARSQAEWMKINFK